MFSRNRPVMQAAHETLQSFRGSEPAFGELVRHGLRHLMDMAPNFDGCVDCDTMQTKHFFSELATLGKQGDDGGEPEDCWLCLLEDMALFFRERFLRHPEEQVPDIERRVMDYFESSGEWHPEDGKYVSQSYWVHLPERWREEYRRRGSVPLIS